MKARLAGITALVVLVAVVLWRPWDDRPPDPVPAPAASPSLPPAASGPDDDVPLPPAPELPPPPAPQLSKLGPEDLRRVRDAIDNVELALRDHAAALGGNPVGTNAEITAALLGDNAKQLKLEVPGDSTVNAAGELCDPWGTPWFFHQLSRTKMEVRSAGPDRILYSDDDFVR